MLQAAVAGLKPGMPYVLALSERPDGGGAIQPLSEFKTNPAGSAIVNSTGPIRQIVAASAPAARRYLIIAPGTAQSPGPPVQVQITSSSR
jgi:hypothetical protein